MHAYIDMIFIQLRTFPLKYAGGGGMAQGEMTPEDLLNMLFHGVPAGFGRQQQYARAQQRRQQGGKSLALAYDILVFPLYRSTPSSLYDCVFSLLIARFRRHTSKLNAEIVSIASHSIDSSHVFHVVF